MSIRIESAKCVGCKRCAAVCPGNLFVVENGKAQIRDARDCWCCTACVKACPKDAIFLTLEASLGGAGGRLYAEDTADTLAWVFRFAGGEQRITVDKHQANAY